MEIMNSINSIYSYSQFLESRTINSGNKIAKTAI